MLIPDYEISLAMPDDILGMVALQEVNLPDKGGSLSVRLTVDWFKDAILKKSVVVCRYNGKVVGYVMGISLAANAHIAIIQAMLCAFPPAARLLPLWSGLRGRKRAWQGPRPRNV